MCAMNSPSGVAVLSNNVEMPWLGLGVWKTPREDTIFAVQTALKYGYRSIDTASVYGNEREVGEALATCDLPREDYFVTTKVWNTDHGYDQTLRAFDASMEKLRLTYLDLYLIHWPEKGKYKETWRAFERLYEQKRVRAIGVSNFHKHHLENLLASCNIKPHVEQLEYHPLLTNDETFEFCRENGIQFEAWSPLMRGNYSMLELGGLCEKYGKSPTQIILRWDIQNGVITIPKSVHENRISENIDIFDFTLTAEEMRYIQSLNRNHRFGNDPDNFHF